MRLGLVTLVLIAVTACGEGGESGEGSGAPGAGAGSCADVIEVDGRAWTSIPLSAPLSRDLVGRPVPGSTQTCVDLEVEGSDGSVTARDPLEAEEVTLRRIRGVPARMALFRSGSPGHRRTVYVPSAPDGEVDDLPRVVRRLVRRG